MKSFIFCRFFYSLRSREGLCLSDIFTCPGRPATLSDGESLKGSTFLKGNKAHVYAREISGSEHSVFFPLEYLQSYFLLGSVIFKRSPTLSDRKNF